MRQFFSRLFLGHPAELGESYLRHLRTAVSIGGSMILAGSACLVHAVFPFLFKTTASRTLRGILARMERRQEAGRT